MTGLTRALRRAAVDPTAVPDLSGLLSATAWHVDRLVRALATATGQPEGAIRTAHGLGPQDQGERPGEATQRAERRRSRQPAADETGSAT